MSGEINKMFSDIHEKYDLMNRMLSLGLDKGWRAAAAREAIIAKEQYNVLDVATGTGDLAIAIKRECDRRNKRVDVTGVDFNVDMLRIAKEKADKNHLRINFELGDALALRFPDNSADVITSGFALRNFDSLDKFIKELYRVLKSGGKVVLMDMSRPDSGFPKQFFRFYSKIMLLEGMLVDKKAYSFLVSSIKEFDREKAAKLLRDYGFKDVRVIDLTTKVAFIITATK